MKKYVLIALCVFGMPQLGLSMVKEKLVVEEKLSPFEQEFKKNEDILLKSEVGSEDMPEYKKSYAFMEKLVSQDKDNKLQWRAKLALGRSHIHQIPVISEEEEEKGAGQEEYKKEQILKHKQQAMIFLTQVLNQKIDLALQEEAKLRIGELLLSLKDYKQAEDWLKQAINQKVSQKVLVEAKSELGQMYTQMEKFEEAENLLLEAEKEAASVDKELQVSVWVDLGNLYDDQKNYDKAIDWFKKVANQEEDKESQVEAWFNLGVIYEQSLSDDEEAIKWYTKAANQDIVSYYKQQAQENLKYLQPEEESEEE